MKRLIAILATTLACFALGAGAAQPGADQDVETLRTLLKAEKKQYVADHLALTGAEAKGFWPVYEAYQRELKTLGDRRIALLTDFAKQYKTISDDKARSLLDDFLAVSREQQRLAHAWLEKFAKVLPGRKLARYYQLEHRLALVVDLNIATHAPLVQ